MKTKEIIEDRPPYVDDNIILVSAFPTSMIALNTDGIAVIDYYDCHYDDEYKPRRRRTFHIFIGPEPREVQWQELTDEQRLSIRMRVNRWSIRPGLGGYVDDRYYILEGLEAA